MFDFEIGTDQLRTILHLIAVCVWVGGQIVLLGLLPTMRRLGGDAPRQVAAAFGMVTWPAFALLVVTGIWNLLDADFVNATSGYQGAFVIKLVVVMLTGFAVAIHQQTSNTAVRAATGALGLLGSLLAFVLGVGLAH